ncbi:MAG TPA: electron transport complex subunit E [Candidatus Cloacimonadota bacterium]|jgi:electron transport complex protein RnfE|nr:electron transport complex subunit E [Candidatus Cloacimonadales bacterium]HPY96206.1 electron transport complex subunit E [Candidatus Cloacimonadota bacterium]HQB40800.1 electron transport complex subunit E [Candidatus Cloacimonadota bacterium]
MSSFKELSKGIFKENPTFVLVLGMCPTLAVTSSLQNAIGMGLAATFVLAFSNILISLLKDLIPSKIRIPGYIVVIASFVSIIDMAMAAYLPDLHKSLGIFIPLIVVNCIILGRAEAFACKNGVFASLMDGVGMGLGFTLSLSVVAIIREILGTGKIWEIAILPQAYIEEPMLVAILAPGAFITLGLLMALINIIKDKKKAVKE